MLDSLTSLRQLFVCLWSTRSRMTAASWTCDSFSQFSDISQNLPSVLRHCWLGIRKGIWPVRKLSDEVLAWLSVWCKVQITCTYGSSWCHCHLSSLFLWCRLTHVVLKKRPLNGCVSVCLSVCLWYHSKPLSNTRQHVLILPTIIARHSREARSGIACCCMLRDAYGLAMVQALLCIVSSFSFFVPGDLDLRTGARFLYIVPNREVWSS